MKENSSLISLSILKSANKMHSSENLKNVTWVSIGQVQIKVSIHLSPKLEVINFMGTIYYSFNKRSKA
jgi:hypothetical protein